MSIDVHAHYFPKSFIDQMAAEGIAFSLPKRQFKTSDNMWSLAARIGDLDRAGIDHQALSLGPPGFGGASHEATVRLVASYNETAVADVAAFPDRFSVFANLPMHDPEVALAEVARWGEHPSVSGFQVFSNDGSRSLDHKDLWPVYAAVERAGKPLFIHPTTPRSLVGFEDWGMLVSIGFLMDTTIAACRLVYSGVLTQFPKLDIILSHLGAVLPYMLPRFEIEMTRAPDLVETTDGSENLDSSVVAQFKRFYLDTVNYHAPAYHCALETWGADRILVGSDYPYSTWHLATSAITDLGLPSGQTASILHDTAARLLHRL
jgi:aminocarboxymuconate-semialdehyde decarboxylase